MLKPIDIEKAEFKKVALGYSQDEVDEFLDRVIMDFETLYKENASLKNTVALLEGEIASFEEKEEGLRQEIEAAQLYAEKAKNEGSRMLELTRKEAQVEAKEILQTANKRVVEMEAEVLKLKNQYKTLSTKLRMLLNAEIEILDQSTEGFDVDNI